MQIYIEFQSKNDGRNYYHTFGSIEEWLKYAKTFRSVPATVSITKERVSIRLNEPIYHTGDFENFPQHGYLSRPPKHKI
jgi:hypothetical protein